MNKLGAISLYNKTFLDPKKLSDLVFLGFDFDKNCYGFLDGDKIVSVGFISYKSLCVNGKVYGFPFLFGLATDSEYKNKGFAKKTISNIIKDLYGKGLPFLGLYPYPVDKSFYEKFGFQTFTFVNKIALKNLVILGTDIKENLTSEELFSLYNKATKNCEIKQNLSAKNFSFNLKKIKAFNGRIFGLYYKDYLYGYVCLDGERLEESFFDLEFINNCKDKILGENSVDFLQPFGLDKNLYLYQFASKKISEDIFSFAQIRPVNYIKFLRVFRNNFSADLDGVSKILVKDEILGNIKLKIVCNNGKIRFYKNFIGKDFVTLTPREFTEYVLFSKTDYNLIKTNKTIFDYAFLDRY